MKSLSTLIKLQKTRVDEQRLILAKMQDQLNAINNKIAELHHEKIEQQRLVQQNPDMGLTYGEYIKAYLKQEENLQRKKKAAEYAVQIAHDKLAEVFEEQKRYEIAEANRIEEELREEQARETKFLDEVGSVGFIRKKKRST